MLAGRTSSGDDGVFPVLGGWLKDSGVSPNGGLPIRLFTLAPFAVVLRRR